MSYKEVSQFEKAFPAVKKMSPEDKEKALGMFNAMLKSDPKMDEGKAIATVLSKFTKEEEMSDHFFSTNIVELSDAKAKTIDVEVLRVGTIRDRNLKITDKMLSDMVQNFKENVYGAELQMNIGHKREGEAGGWIKDLYLKGQSLMAKVEVTALGIEKLSNKLYKYVSAEFADRFPHHESGKVVDNVFIGLALTNVPALKGQSPIVLSEQIQLTNLDNTMFKTFITSLKERTHVSKEDKALARQLLNELPEEEQKEAEADVAEVEAKPEPEAAPAEGEGKSEEKKEGEGTPAPAPAEGEPEAPKAEELSEKLDATTKLAEEQAAKIKQLEENAMRTELSEEFTNTYLLSDKREVGLLGKHKDKVVDFLMKLSEEDRATFKELMTEVQYVKLGSIGSSQELDSAAMNEEIMKKAHELSEKSGRPVHEHLTELYAEQAIADKK